jgi:hemerythrin superfamily protein
MAATMTSLVSAQGRQRSCFAESAGGAPMKATDLLKQQHREVMDLFEEIEEADDAESRKRLMKEIVDHVKVHSKIEEEIFYPAVRGLGTQKAQEMIGEALEEHHVVDLVIADLPSVDPEDERFEAKMTVFHELIEHHAKEEEKEMFKSAQRLGKGELEALGEQMEARAEELKLKGRRAA